MILTRNRNLGKYVDEAKDPNDDFRLMGFGHRVYKATIPAARSSSRWPTACWPSTARKTRCSSWRRNSEELALKDPTSSTVSSIPTSTSTPGIIYRVIGIPKRHVTVLFALGRLRLDRPLA